MSATCREPVTIGGRFPSDSCVPMGVPQPYEHLPWQWCGEGVVRSDRQLRRTPWASVRLCFAVPGLLASSNTGTRLFATRPFMAGAHVLGMIWMQPDARGSGMLDANISVRLGRRRKIGKGRHLDMAVKGGEKLTIQAPGVGVWWLLTKPPPLTQPT